jgi:hypothetical protein
MEIRSAIRIDHRGEQAGTPRALLLRSRQFAGEDRDEDDVVDAENDFEKRERRQAKQALRCEKRIHYQNVSFVDEPDAQ